jgi:hypothetical protein
MLRSQDSVVGIATGYGLDDRGVGVRVPVGSRINTLIHGEQNRSDIRNENWCVRASFVLHRWLH